MTSPTNKRVVIINIIMNDNLNLQRIVINRRMARLYNMTLDSKLASVLYHSTIFHIEWWQHPDRSSQVEVPQEADLRVVSMYSTAVLYELDSSSWRDVTSGLRWSLFHRRRSLDETRVVYVEHTLTTMNLKQQQNYRRDRKNLKISQY